ncbi:MAG: DNA repair protein RecO [Prevotella sp.]|nr:DNA repair protein RecO [Prevotella sp.]
MLQKTEAVVLHALKYGEQKVIVDMFTREHGWLSFAVPMPKSQRARVGKQLLQPLTLLYIEADVRPQLSLQKLTDATLLVPLPRLLNDPAKLAIGLFTAEFLYHALRGEQRDVALFDYVRTALEWLDGADVGYANFHLVFLMRLSRFLGFYPNLENHEPDCYFDLRQSVFTPQPPLHRDFLMPQEADHIRLLMRMDFATMHLFRLSRLQRRRILEILLLYYRLHLPQMPELRSPDVLSELF